MGSEIISDGEGYQGIRCCGESDSNCNIKVTKKVQQLLKRIFPATESVIYGGVKRIFRSLNSQKPHLQQPTKVNRVLTYVYQNKRLTTFSSHCDSVTVTFSTLHMWSGLKIEDFIYIPIYYIYYYIITIIIYTLF